MSKVIPLKNLNIVPNCQLQIINETSMKWQNKGKPIEYTPAHINAALKRAKLESGWVNTPWGREFWFAGKGNLAKQAGRK